MAKQKKSTYWSSTRTSCHSCHSTMVAGSRSITSITRKTDQTYPDQFKVFKVFWARSCLCVIARWPRPLGSSGFCHRLDANLGFGNLTARLTAPNVYRWLNSINLLASINSAWFWQIWQGISMCAFVQQFHHGPATAVNCWVYESMSSFNAEVQFQRLDVPLSDLQNCNKSIKIAKDVFLQVPTLSNLSPPWLQPLTRRVAISQWAPELALNFPNTQLLWFPRVADWAVCQRDQVWRIKDILPAGF